MDEFAKPAGARKMIVPPIGVGASRRQHRIGAGLRAGQPCACAYLPDLDQGVHPSAFRQMLRSKPVSRDGTGSEKCDLVGIEEPGETLVEGDEVVALGAVGFVPDDAVGKVAASREHRYPSLGGGSLYLD